MIRRLLCRVADWLTDTDWLRGMRYREVQARRSAMHHERVNRVEAAYLARRGEGGRDA